MTDIAVKKLSEGAEALEWSSRNWLREILVEARDGGITREELDILKDGLFASRKACREAWQKFVTKRTQDPINNSIMFMDSTKELREMNKMSKEEYQKYTEDVKTDNNLDDEMFAHTIDEVQKAYRAPVFYNTGRRQEDKK